MHVAADDDLGIKASGSNLRILVAISGRDDTLFWGVVPKRKFADFAMLVPAFSDEGAIKACVFLPPMHWHQRFMHLHSRHLLLEGRVVIPTRVAR